MSTLLQWDDEKIEILNFNNDFLLLRSEDHTYLNQVGRAIFKGQFEFINEVIVTEKEICLQTNDHFNESKINLLKSIQIAQATSSELYNLPVYFEDHGDWDIVEGFTSMKKIDVISKLLSSTFKIVMFGFLPGFIYMEGLDPKLRVPRKRVPAKYVSENSLAIGGKYLGIYSLASPGGWNVVGRLPIPVLNLPGIPPVDLNLSDQLKLEVIDEKRFHQLKSSSISLKEYNE